MYLFIVSQVIITFIKIKLFDSFHIVSLAPEQSNTVIIGEFSTNNIGEVSKNTVNL